MIAEDTQKDVLAFLLQNPSAYVFYKDYMKPGEFFNGVMDDIYTVLYHAHTQTRTFPTQSELIQILSRIQANKSGLIRGITTEEVGFLFDREITGLTNEILNQVVIQKTLYNMTDNLSSELQRNPNVERLQELLQTTRTNLDRLTTTTKTDNEIGFLPFAEDNMRDRINLYEQLYQGEPLPTGFREMDSNIRGGGIRPKTVTVVLGYTGGGKTALVLNMALNFVIHGARVVYYALDNLDVELTERMDSRLTNIPINEPKEMNTYSQQVSEAVLRQIGCNAADKFIIKTYPPKTVNIYNLMSHLNLVEYRYGQVDVVIIDQGDLIKPTAKYDQLRHGLEHVYSEFLTLGMKHNTRVIATSQGNRQSLSARTITMEHIAEAYAKTWVASFVIAVCRSDEERMHNQARLCLAKNRFGNSNLIIPVNMDLSRMYVYDRTDVQAFFLNRDNRSEERNNLVNRQTGYLPFQTGGSN